MTDFEMAMQELEALSNERMKKSYISNGAQEPLFGAATGKMKPIAKKIKGNQLVAEQLYATGNYDAMYLAGMIADTTSMTESDFERWIDAAYFYIISDHVVSVTLAETDFAQAVADKWIASGEEHECRQVGVAIAGFGNRKDEEFSTSKLAGMLEQVKKTIHDSPDRTKSSMNKYMSTLSQYRICTSP
jgi:3-methyladenine DNA glycosylase AlkD